MVEIMGIWYNKAMPRCPECQGLWKSGDHTYTADAEPHSSEGVVRTCENNHTWEVSRKRIRRG